jgi:hypothetical protein
MEGLYGRTYFHEQSEKLSELGKTLAVTSNGSKLRRNISVGSY